MGKVEDSLRLYLDSLGKIGYRSDQFLLETSPLTTMNIGYSELSSGDILRNLKLIVHLDLNEKWEAFKKLCLEVSEQEDPFLILTVNKPGMLDNLKGLRKTKTSYDQYRYSSREGKLSIIDSIVLQQPDHLTDVRYSTSKEGKETELSLDDIRLYTTKTGNDEDILDFARKFDEAVFD